MLDNFKNFDMKNFFHIFMIIVILFLLIFSLKFIKYTETSEFCGTCHSMKEQYKSWSHSSHKNIKCIDCHLPNDNFFNHYFWKAVDGVKDVTFEVLSLKQDYKIRLSKHGKKVLQTNCIRCHQNMVSHIDNKRSCSDCHRNISHKMITNFCNYNTVNLNK